MKKLGLTFVDFVMLGMVSMLCTIVYFSVCIALFRILVKIILWLQPIARRAFDKGANWYTAIKAWIKRQKESKVSREIA